MSKKKYCCEAFDEHVKWKFFREVKKWSYETKWLTLVTKLIKRRGWFIQDSPDINFNWMPIYYCPFCGSKLDLDK